MKRTLAIGVIFTIIAFPILGQEEQKMQKLENLENKTDKKSAKDTTKVEVGREIFSYEESGDEARIRLGKNEYRVVEKGNGVVVYKNDRKEGNEFSFKKNKKDRFRGHLGGLEFGFNSYMYSDWSTSLTPEDYFMDVNTVKSNNWNFVLPCLSIGFARNFGIAASLGINFNKYRFDGNNSIAKDGTGVIGPTYPEPGIVYSKSKLATTYATLPVLLEGQIPVSHRNSINIGAGVIGGILLGAHTKTVYETDGKQKEKNKDDFSLSPLRWGATARVGYGCFQVYGTRYFTQFFENGKGPELYPYEIGVAFTFNN